MAKKLGMVLMVGGLSLTALAGAAAITASTSIATSLPRPDAPSDVTPAQAAKPVPPAPPPARREENGPDGGSIGGKRATPPPQEAAAPGEPPAAARPRRDIRVETRDADVRVNPNNGRVRVDAPYTFVDVNPDRGRAVIRAPGVNLDIRW
jgi:hypothetical protein